MNTDVQDYVIKYPDQIQQLFIELRTLIFQSAPCEIVEKLWAKLPSYYNEDKFIRLIPFKDHINIVAASIVKYEDELKDFKITPKGMLQIYSNQYIPIDVLKKIFLETLSNLP